MDPKVKNYLGVAIIAVLVIFAFSAVSYVRSYARSIDPFARTFSVVGEGKVVAVPDIARFTFEAITQGGTNLGELQTANTQKVNGAIAFVKSKGVEDKDIKTEGYNVEPPRYQNFACAGREFSIPGQPVSVVPKPCPPPEIVGYTIRQTVSVKVRKFDAIGDILSGVVQNGANSISQLSFTIDDDRTALENQAREEAIKKAKEKAEALARAAGFRIGRLMSLSEEGGQPPFYPYAEARAFGVGGDIEVAPAPTIEPGSQEVTVRMILNYEIK